MHLADAFIQSDLQLRSGYTFSLVHVFPGNRTHNLLRSWRNALPLSHTGTKLLSQTKCVKSYNQVDFYFDSWYFESVTGTSSSGGLTNKC